VWRSSPTWEVDWKLFGPCIVVRRLSTDGYGLEVPAIIRIHQVQPVSLLDPLVTDPIEGHVVPTPPPVEVDGEEEYQVAGVEDSRVH
jgi:hypothetical protein